ncbi:MAG: hypothetical protein INR69_24450, partial [Mucilaginibacter polytrichastri]|nr:hypothetical protein [Mucilaginibacter polytrichastri]
MMKGKFAFTICTNSYLPQARILADSIRQWAPEYTFYVFLADELDPTVRYETFENLTLKPASELPIDFAALVKKYGIIELNTCIKASCFKWLFKEFDAGQVHFFDPDICFFSDIKILDDHFNKASILVTPHITQPIPWQDGSPTENLFLNHGLYNLGYLGLKRSTATFAMLDWWEEN